MHQVSYPVTVLRGLLHDALHLGTVRKSQFPASSEGQQFYGKGPGQALWLACQVPLEFRETRELKAVLEFSGGIHHRALPVGHLAPLGQLGNPGGPGVKKNRGANFFEN